MDSLRRAALVLAGHGSTQNDESSRPTRSHVEELLKRNIFAEVHACFWLEEPYFKDVLGQVGAREVYVVPNFLCEGYYTREVLPRELALSGPVTEIGGRHVYYCDPVGLHPLMTELLLQRARSIIQHAGLKAEETCLFVAGHGTPRNSNSTRIIYDQVERIRKLGHYGQVEAIFMEEEPFIKNWPSMTLFKNVVVVPFFISDGLHCAEDIPVMLGLANEDQEGLNDHPGELRDCRVWYAPAIGTEPGMVEVILAQVLKFRAMHLAGVV